MFYNFNAATPLPDCRDDEISCDGRCAPSYIRCDGRVDCGDGSDELNCPTTEQPIRTTKGYPLVNIHGEFFTAFP